MIPKLWTSKRFLREAGINGGGSIWSYNTINSLEMLQFANVDLTSKEISFIPSSQIQIPLYFNHAQQ